MMKLRLVSRKRETASVQSLEFAPADGGVCRPFRAGQHLVFRLTLPDGSQLLRPYSISSSTLQCGSYRISVQLATAPRPGLPPGRASGFLHRGLEIGDEVDVFGPCGQFAVDEASQKAVLLIGCGIGQTPLVSMFDWLVRNRQRPVYFIHACTNGGEHSFRDEVAAIAALRPETHLHVAYRHPTEDDRRGRYLHSEGLLTRETLQRFLPLDAYEAYCCGDTPFLFQITDILQEIGVPPHLITCQSFDAVGAAPDMSDAAPDCRAAAGITAAFAGKADD